MIRTAALTATLVLSGCAQEYALAPVDVGDGAAVEAWEDPSGQHRQEAFAIGDGASTPIADYLFVVDNSSSMKNVIERVQRALLALSTADAFPKGARIAVMSTLPARFDKANRPHQAVLARAPVPALDPGFQRLVDAAGIARFRAAAPAPFAQRFPMDGCTAWFGPGDKNAAGVPCLVAHTQIALGDVGVEAGLTAVKQLIESAKAPVFRPGAAVNVVFVSDTHDPGKQPRDRFTRIDELIANRPDFAALEAVVLAREPVASFTVHAIAPRTECSERWAELGPVYFDAAEASGGQTLDVCTAEDYTPLLRQVATQGAVVKRPVFPLGRDAHQVEWVEVDGNRVSHRVHARRVVEITEPGVVERPARGERAEVMVHYRPARRGDKPATVDPTPATATPTARPVHRPARDRPVGGDR